jgi:glycosyltransferase involved in cell wall biosynthesis
METLRIAQVAPYFHPHVGGVESHVEGICAELARRGHDVEVVTAQLPGAPLREHRDGYAVRRVRQRLNLFTTPITPALGVALGGAPRDVVHAHSPPPLSSYQAARWCERRGVPFVLTYHCDLEIPLPGGQAIVEIYRRTLGRATVRRAAALVATTRTYAQTSRALWHRTDVDVVPNAVDEQRFRPEGEGGLVRRRHRLGDRKVALFVGRLTHHKGIEEFIRAAQATGPDVVHVIVGDGPRRDALEAMARRVDPDRIVFAGRVDGRDLPLYYRCASVGVLPSTSRLEAFGIAALECMASGRPVVVSDMPGVEEVIEHGATGLLAAPLNAEDLAAKIRVITEDPELGASMGKAARERVLERFTLGRIVDRLVEVYRRVVA